MVRHVPLGMLSSAGMSRTLAPSPQLLRKIPWALSPSIGENRFVTLQLTSYIYPPSAPSLTFFFSSLWYVFLLPNLRPSLGYLLIIPAAFWLRSSVVSVLFSLISETSLYVASFINLIFVSRELAAVLAHAGSHCVTGIALSPVDATGFFHCCFGYLARERGRKWWLGFVHWCFIWVYWYCTPSWFGLLSSCLID
jgi:hypothetical protein